MRFWNSYRPTQDAAPCKQRCLWVLLLILLLVSVLAGCTHAVLAMPVRVETPTAATATPQQPTGEGEISESDVVGLSLESVRAIFVHEDTDTESSLPRLLYNAALHSPLTTALDAEGQDVRVSLPTPTRTPLHTHPVALVGTAPVTPTAPITSMLQLPLPGNSGTPEPEVAGHSAVGLPTPTPQPQIAAVATQPTPDGVARSVLVPILMYHYLSVPPQDADIYRRDLSVPPELFAAHLDAMQAAGYTTITLYELVAHLAQGAPLPENPVIITFDDGYRDMYENAFPLLRERELVATFFVVTDFIDEGRPEYLTWDMAREMLADGMKIESHGRNHVSLQDKDHDYLVWQALGSKETIEYELGARPRFVSYPAGEYDMATADLFASAEYWAGVTTVQGATHSSDSLFDLNRVRVRGTTSPEELLRLLALDW